MIGAKTTSAGVVSPIPNNVSAKSGIPKNQNDEEMSLLKKDDRGRGRLEKLQRSG